MRYIKWGAIVLLGGVVWGEIFLQYPVQAVVLLAVGGGLWDYMRRRGKLKPPGL